MTATPGPYTTDFHHAQTRGGTTYGFIRARGRLDPIATAILSVDGYAAPENRDTLTLLAASWDLRRLLARIVKRNRTPDDVADPDVVEARRLLREIGI
jgi:hypothetical protein